MQVVAKDRQIERYALDNDGLKVNSLQSSEHHLVIIN